MVEDLKVVHRPEPSLSNPPSPLFVNGVACISNDEEVYVCMVATLVHRFCTSSLFSFYTVYFARGLCVFNLSLLRVVSFTILPLLLGVGDTFLSTKAIF